MDTPRLGSTLLGVALAAIAITPALDRSGIVPLGAAHAPVPYDAVAALSAGDLVRHVAALVADTFALPLPRQVVLRLYPTRIAFAHGLVHEVGVAPRVAFEVADSAIGLALPGTVFLLAEGEDDDRVRLVAHEVMHLAQHELAGATARPAQWVMEGTAEWAALTLLDRLGVAGIAERRRAARAAAHGYLAGAPLFTPAVAQRPGDFRRWQRSVGSLMAYQVAYAMAEHLVTRHGLPAVVAYFRAFRDEDDLAKNFERAFGTSTAQFTVDARAALALPPS